MDAEQPKQPAEGRCGKCFGRRTLTIFGAVVPCPCVAEGAGSSKWFSCPFCGEAGITSEYDSFGTTLYCADGCHGRFNFPAFEAEVMAMWKRERRSNSPIRRSAAALSTQTERRMNTPDDSNTTGAGHGREEDSRAVSGSAPGVSAEATAWWRALVKPIFLAMHDKGIGEIRIKRIGAKVIFELTPEAPNEKGQR